jgi:hypothetical protein
MSSSGARAISVTCEAESALEAVERTSECADVCCRMLPYASLAGGLDTVASGAPSECSSLVLCAASVLGLSLALSDFGLSLSASSNCGTCDTEGGWRARLDLCERRDLCAASLFSSTPPDAGVCWRMLAYADVCLALCAACVVSTPPYADVGCIPVPAAEEGARSRSSGCAVWFGFSLASILLLAKPAEGALSAAESAVMLLAALLLLLTALLLLLTALLLLSDCFTAALLAALLLKSAAKSSVMLLTASERLATYRCASATCAHSLQ